MTTLPPLGSTNPTQQKVKPAPYDERNAADYHELSLRIAKALETIEHDQTIPATQTALTQLAGCSRGTLRNRGWPLDRLNLINQKRAAKPRSPLPQTATEIERFDRKKLYEDLQASRTEAARQFEQAQNEKSVSRKLRRTIKLMGEEIAALKAQIAARDVQGERRTDPKTQSSSSTNVRPFPAK